MHPALLLLAIILFSQFGFIWVLLAAPIAVVLRDLFRYVYGRVSDPPRPAGLLPSGVIVDDEGTPLPPPRPIRRRRARAARRLPEQRAA
jgi:hypothetical protein